MDCSSPYAMAGLIGLKDRFDIAFGNDPDCGPPRHRHPQRRAAESQPLPGRGHLVSVPAPARLARRCGRGQDAGLQLDDRPGGGQPGPPAGRGAGRASSGSWTACWTARSASAARRAPGPRSCATTARSGPPTRTASSWICWPPRSPRSPGRDPGEHYQALEDAVRPPRLRAHRRARQRGAEGGAGKPLAGAGARRRTLAGRADHRQADARTGQRRGHRRAEGGHRERLVRGPAIGHRGCLQDLRRELPGRRIICGGSRARPRPSSMPRFERQTCRILPLNSCTRAKMCRPRRPRNTEAHKGISGLRNGMNDFVVRVSSVPARSGKVRSCADGRRSSHDLSHTLHCFFPHLGLDAGCLPPGALRH